MNQSRAKKIRKKVYGDKSRRDVSYTVEENARGKQLICTGLRDEYKKRKKEWKELSHVRRKNQ